MSTHAEYFVREIWHAIGGAPDAFGALEISGPVSLPSAFAVSDLAAASIGAAGLAIREVMIEDGGAPPSVHVDRRLASRWFGMSIEPVGWSLASIWDAIAGDYATKDGWIRLHTNAPHHRAAAERVLGTQSDRNGMAKAVATWDAAALEAAIVAHGGCAAQMRGIDAWGAHPQGRAVAMEPLVHMSPIPPAATPSRPRPSPSRPLAGVRVLDLTRVLAGPIATRFLAGFGADVLRIDPPSWNEPSIEPEVTLGKRCAGLDLRNSVDLARLENLIRSADVLVHGYRPGALDHLGLGESRRAKLRPGLVDVCLDAYGWSGPWAERRGFDSLVQMSCGIADAGMHWKAASRPVPLPVQALDHATGYIMAAAVVRGIAKQRRDGGGLVARTSLARTAALLLGAGRVDIDVPSSGDLPSDFGGEIEANGWGPVRRLRAPLSIEGAPMAWALPGGRLRSSPPDWA
jgi:hypothetical protein